MNIEEILEEIEELVEKSATVPFVSHKKMVDSDRLRELISDARMNLPQELKEAKYECLYYNAYTIGRMRYQMAKGYHNEIKDKRNYWNALRAFTNALLYAKDGGHDFEDTYDAISNMVFAAIDSISQNEDYMLGYFDENSKCLIMMETINANMHEIQKYIKEKYAHIRKYAVFSKYMKRWANIYTSILQITDDKEEN